MNFQPKVEGNSADGHEATGVFRLYAKQGVAHELRTLSWERLRRYDS